MTNAIIIAVIGIFVVLGVKNTVKHFKGEGGCCGGAPAKVKKKRLKNAAYSKILVIEGMSCEHCKTRVEQALNDLEGVFAKVNLKRKEATVKSEVEISDEKLREVIKKAGYEVVNIR